MQGTVTRRAFLATVGAAGAGAFLFSPRSKPVRPPKTTTTTGLPPTTTTAAPTTTVAPTTTTTAQPGADPYMGGPYGGSY